ncbi:MAG: ubiquinone/menaquinone biosynthesis C-methylase UbiE [Planctomycetota bacterium]|jgi:ubiquinone/menaquinone biosynthesis C-methylase UbiE
MSTAPSSELPESASAEGSVRAAAGAQPPLVDPSLLDAILGTCGAGRLLDLGCGDGGLVTALLREGVDSVGADVVHADVAHGDKSDGACLGDRYSYASMLALPFSADDFDTTVCLNTLDLLTEDDVPAALAELARVTRHQVFVRVRTQAGDDGDASGPVIAQARRWWDEQFFDAGFRKHPLHLRIADYESLEQEGSHIDLVFEKLTAATLSRFPRAKLKEERDLHMDMLRESGRRAEAHVVRYWAAAPYIRPGDTVLDVACGLGYGSAVIAAETSCRAVIGIDNSEFAIEYATATTTSRYPCVEFQCGDAARLSSIADNSIDFVTSFETLEHLPDPVGFLAELHRVMRPGGRMIVSVPHMWVDETGEDPNPFHLHVYDWAKLREQIEAGFQLEAGFAQIAGGGMTHHDGHRRLVRFPSTEDPKMDSEWWLALGMKSPVDAADVPYVETHFPAHEDVEGFHVTNFARDYDNPWIVRGLVSIGLRSTDDHQLASMADEVALTAAAGSADQGAVLCLQAYRLLGEGGASATQVNEMVGVLHGYRETAQATPHAQRWRISCTYVAAMLLMSIGQREAARLTFLECAADDPMVFSPLLGSKTIDALYRAGLISACDGDLNAAADNWLRAIKEAQRLICGDWTNVWGRPEVPLSFGLPEVRQLCDLATRCASALRSVEDWRLRPGVAWREAHRNADQDFRHLQQQVGDLSSWIAELEQLKQLGWARATDLEVEVQASIIALHATKSELEASRTELQTANSELQTSRAHAVQVQDELHQLKHSLGHRILSVLSRVRLVVAPKGSRRDRFLWLGMRAVAGLRHGPFGPYRAVKQARQQLDQGKVESPLEPKKPD